MSEEEIINVIERARDAVVGIESAAVPNLFDETGSPRQGSGLVVDEEGYIVTNYHVIMDAESVYVTHENELLQGIVVNICAPIDLALVKVDSSLPAAELGNSDEVKVGQRVYAIGVPFGIRGAPTVTSGIISGTRRFMKTRIGQDSIFHSDIIQTDASVNPGSSGGPLINAQGKVIGVSMAKILGGQGMGFSIPINTVKQYFSQIKAEGKYDISWIGIKDAVTITPLLNKQFNLGTDYGALITDVVNESPLEEAGLGSNKWSKLFRLDHDNQRGLYSVISFNDAKVESLDDLLTMIRHSSVGNMVKLKIICKGRTEEVGVKIGQIS